MVQRRCEVSQRHYSQIELWLLAHFSQDEALMHAFKEGKDIHAETAARIFG
ncbi:MAG TPA: hypothetical protein ENK98_04085, partial [Epsilonproteobacteria bacterium]|nr:hypothetical protein [Campylobacterota bacterium]